MSFATYKRIRIPIYVLMLLPLYSKFKLASFFIKIRLSNQSHWMSVHINAHDRLQPNFSYFHIYIYNIFNL